MVINVVSVAIVFLLYYLCYLCAKIDDIGFMEIKRVYKVYFSATYTTRKVVDGIAGGLCDNVVDCDVTSQPLSETIEMGRGDVLVIGMPVYGGRIPESTLQSIARLNGNVAPAVISCVYGNRDYDDALLELRNEVEARGFKIVSASAFIARHSIFTQIAKDRPDAKDMADVTEFAVRSKSVIEYLDDFSQLQQIDVKGNMPYKVFNQLPIYPSANGNCVECGVCATKCPVGAISVVTPKETDESKCIACGRCIVECAVGARDFRGEFFEARAAKFQEAFSVPRTNETYFAYLNK